MYRALGFQTIGLLALGLAAIPQQHAVSGCTERR